MVESILSIKPLIDMTGGVVHEAGEVRTHRWFMPLLYEQMIDVGTIAHVAAMHSETPGIDEFFDLIEPHFPHGSIRAGVLGAAIGSHGGAEILRVSWVDAG